MDTSNNLLRSPQVVRPLLSKSGDSAAQRNTDDEPNNAKKRRTSQRLSFPRKRAIAACEPCRARKVSFVHAFSPDRVRGNANIIFI